MCLSLVLLSDCPITCIWLSISFNISLAANQGDLGFPSYKNQDNLVHSCFDYWFSPFFENTSPIKVNYLAIGSVYSNSYLILLILIRWVISHFLKRGSWGWIIGSSLKLNSDSLSLKIPVGVVWIFHTYREYSSKFPFSCLSFWKLSSNSFINWLHV